MSNHPMNDQDRSGCVLVVLPLVVLIAAVIWLVVSR